MNKPTIIVGSIFARASRHRRTPSGRDIAIVFCERCGAEEHAHVRAPRNARELVFSILRGQLVHLPSCGVIAKAAAIIACVAFFLACGGRSSSSSTDASDATSASSTDAGDATRSSSTDASDATSASSTDAGDATSASSTDASDATSASSTDAGDASGTDASDVDVDAPKAPCSGYVDAARPTLREAGYDLEDAIAVGDGGICQGFGCWFQCRTGLCLQSSDCMTGWVCLIDADAGINPDGVPGVCATESSEL